MTKNNSLQSHDLDSNHIAYSNFDISHALTPEELAAIFPRQLSGLEKTAIKLDQTTGTATAFYGNKYEINITDDLRNNFSNIHLFKNEFGRLKSSLPGIEVIKVVRDGYKTITKIENRKRVSISFIFNHRYIFTIVGIDGQTPYMVWRFLQLNKFHNL